MRPAGSPGSSPPLAPLAGGVFWTFTTTGGVAGAGGAGWRDGQFPMAAALGALVTLALRSGWPWKGLVQTGYGFCLVAGLLAS